MRDRNQEPTTRLLGVPGGIQSLGAGEQQQCSPQCWDDVTHIKGMQLTVPSAGHCRFQPFPQECTRSSQRWWLVTHTSCTQTEISLWYRAQLSEATQCISLEESDSESNRRLALSTSPFQSHNPCYLRSSRTLCPPLPTSAFAEIMNELCLFAWHNSSWAL